MKQSMYTSYTDGIQCNSVLWMLCRVTGCVVADSDVTIHLQRMEFFIIIIFNYVLQPFKAYCEIWVRRSNFHHQASPRVLPHESTQRRMVELWARNFR
jgi:hypothetical protein